MKKTKLLAILAAVVIFSSGSNTMAKDLVKKAPEFKVAVVDIQKIVESSPQINALRVDRKNKIDELAAFVERARADVEKETNAAKKKSLEENYNKELNTRKDIIDKDYAQKLSDIDKNITTIIKSSSKAQGYDLVLTKTTVLDGGIDITNDIIKKLK